MVIKLLVTVLATLGQTNAVAATSPSCAELLRHASPPLRCVADARGVALAPSEARARHLIEIGSRAEPIFQKHFGVAAGPWVIVEDATLPPDALGSLRRAGVFVLPWLSPARLSEQMRTRLGAAVRAAAKAQNLPPPAEDQMVEEMLHKAKEEVSEEATQRRELGLLPHELGHGWLIHGFWPGNWKSQPSYGGPAPDWLDELAGVLLEDDRLTEERRRSFARQLALGSSADLLTFLRSEHPKAGTSGEAGPASGLRVAVRASPQQGKAGIDYYLMVRAFADYLLARSGNPAIFGELARTLEVGTSLQEWLASSGRRNSLPDNLGDLQSDFQTFSIQASGL